MKEAFFGNSGFECKDKEKLLVNELNLLIARANTINDYLGLIDRQLELLYLKEKISK